MKELTISLVVVIFLLVSSTTFGFMLTAQDIGGGQLQIGYQVDPGEVPIGFALNIELIPDAHIAEVSGAVVSPHFPVYMDSAYTQELTAPGSYVQGSGTPIAEISAPGELVLPASSFSICIAAPTPHNSELSLMASEWLMLGSTSSDYNFDMQVDLRDYATLAGAEWFGSLDNLVTLHLDGSGFVDVMISADPLRGGVIDQNGGGLDFSPVIQTVQVPEPATVLLIGLGTMALGIRNKG